MTVRLATETDVDAIVAMGGHFIQHVYPCDIPFNPEAIAGFARQLIDSPDGAIYLALCEHAVVGMLALTAYRHPMSGERIATEVCWWVEPPHRGIGMRLFKAAEQWSRTQHAAVFQMIAPTRQVADFYERIGFRPIETTYQRRLAS